MPIQLTSQNEQELRRIAQDTGLSEDALANIAVSSFASSKEAQEEAQLREERQFWLDLYNESIRLDNERLANLPDIDYA
jgi:hypothetical protein